MKTKACDKEAPSIGHFLHHGERNFGSNILNLFSKLDRFAATENTSSKKLSNLHIGFQKITTDVFIELAPETCTTELY